MKKFKFDMLYKHYYDLSQHRPVSEIRLPENFHIVLKSKNILDWCLSLLDTAPSWLLIIIINGSLEYRKICRPAIPIACKGDIHKITEIHKKHLENLIKKTNEK